MHSHNFTNVVLNITLYLHIGTRLRALVPMNSSQLQVLLIFVPIYSDK